MKKIFSGLLALSICLPAFLGAKQVSQRQAEAVSHRLVRLENASARLRLTKGELRWASIEPLYYSDELVGYVVGLDPRGFMLLSDITEASPMKFISYSGDFEGIKDHPLIQSIVQRLLYDKAKLQYTVKKGVKVRSGSKYPDTRNKAQTAKNEARWKQLLDSLEELAGKPPAGDVAPFTTSTWNQDAPYNMYAPLVSGQPTYTGCSNTAQSQVMFYWKYPVTGQGSYSYSWKGETLSADFAHEYYWDRMMNNYTGAETDEQKDAVARLMSDVGIANGTDYGTGGSGAVFNNNNALVTYFKYSDSVQFLFRSSYASWSEWFDVFRKQVDKKWPALMAMFKPGSGHAVVIDGYRTSPGDQVHVNMGWGGYADNYYDMGNIYGYGDANSDYAVVNIHPPFQKDDLVGTWSGQGAYYRNSDTTDWVSIASPADLIAAGDLDGDGVDDLIGIWPGQGGVWMKHSSDGQWALLSSPARSIAAGDLSGDGRADLVGSWDGQGVFYRDSINGAWTLLASPAEKVVAGDLDGDGLDDLVGIWLGQGGVWMKSGKTGEWSLLSSTANDIAIGDMNGDGRADLVGTWDGQGVYYRDSASGDWIMMASPAEQIAAGDLDGDGTDDLIGLWSGQGGVWTKSADTGEWTFLSSAAVDITAGKMRQFATQTPANAIILAAPLGGSEFGPFALPGPDPADTSPGGKKFTFRSAGELKPRESGHVLRRIPGPGDPGFECKKQGNLIPKPGGKPENK